MADHDSSTDPFTDDNVTQIGEHLDKPRVFNTRSGLTPANPDTVQYTIDRLAYESWIVSDNHGWHGIDRTTGDLLLLIVSEIVEALEEMRNGHELDEVYYVTDQFGQQKPEGFPIELADAIIRIGDLAAQSNIDIEAAVRIKMKFNIERPYLHGGKKL